MLYLLHDYHHIFSNTGPKRERERKKDFNNTENLMLEIKVRHQNLNKVERKSDK